ncbi:MAG: hypothetical protein IJE43_20325 [Alphaproteobacteria bacterium]|nr:hypothetical protein [Alphaproteobacteria bacterium]
MLLEYWIILVYLLIRRNFFTDGDKTTPNARKCLGSRGGIRVDEIIFRCPKDCPWNKQCFICKIQGEVSGELVILHKCDVTKEDIPIRIKKRQETA